MLRPFASLLPLLAILLAGTPALAQQQPAIDASLARLLQPEVRARVAAHGLVRPDQPPEEQPFSGAYSLDTDAAGRLRVAVLVELPVIGRDAVLDMLRGAGAAVGVIVGDIAVVRVPLDGLDVLEALPVQRAEAARLLRSTHDSSVVATGAHLVRHRDAGGWSGTTGAGAIVGIVDSGIDILHPDFLDDDGNTRIAGVWDQLVGTMPPPGFSYGFHCTRSAVQAVISTGNLAACPTSDLAGHGTHVAGTAAGSGEAGPEPFRYAGMAPEADLLIVRAGNNTFAEDRVVEGVVWLHDQAQQLGRPMVVNLSLGHQYGPHDGSLLFERMLNTLAGPGFIIVVAAGNEGANMNAVPADTAPHLIHARAFTAGGMAAAVQFVVTPYTPAANLCTGNFIDLSAWYDVRDRVEVAVLRPDGSGHAAGTGSTATSDHPGGRIQIRNAMPLYAQAGVAEAAIHVSGCGESGAPAPGTWTVIFRALDSGGGNAPVDLYINNARLGSTGRATGGAGFDNRFIVGSPGNAERVITVGGFTTRNCWPTRAGGTSCYGSRTAIGDLTPFSAGGPTRDGRIKPEITAPGAAIISSLSRNLSVPADRIAPGGWHWAMEGTSMAAPHVAGAVALLLEHRFSLTPEDVREILVTSARQDAFTQRTYDLSADARPSDWWGYGKLDVPGALAELLGTGATTTLGITPQLDSIPAGGALQLTATALTDDGEAAYANVDWSSLDPAIALVSAHGHVRGVAPGTARIVATAHAAADTALVIVEPPALLTLTAASAAPSLPAQAPAGALLPLMTVTLDARGPEAVAVTALAFQVTGTDPAARLLLLDDASGSGLEEDPPRILTARNVVLLGPARTFVLEPADLVVQRNTQRQVMLVLEVSGRAASGTGFTARLLEAGTETVTLNSRVANRFELAGSLASDTATTTILRPGELVALSENPVRRDGVRMSFAAPPTVAGVYTATGSRVVNLLPRINGLTVVWDLTNDQGRRIVPGVYLLVARVNGRVVRERIIVLSPRTDGEP